MHYLRFSGPLKPELVKNMMSNLHFLFFSTVLSQIIAIIYCTMHQIYNV